MATTLNAFSIHMPPVLADHNVVHLEYEGIKFVCASAAMVDEPKKGLSTGKKAKVFGESRMEDIQAVGEYLTNLLLDSFNAQMGDYLEDPYKTKLQTYCNETDYTRREYDTSVGNPKLTDSFRNDSPQNLQNLQEKIEAYI